MLVTSKLVAVMVTVNSFLAGLVALPVRADSHLPFDWVRNLNSTAWGYSQVEDPSEYGSNRLVERFELRMGDCGKNETENDCKSNQNINTKIYSKSYRKNEKDKKRRS